MGRKCSVENCTSDSKKEEHEGVTFHKVPPHGDLRPKWLSLCHIPEEKANLKMIFVCSRHFLKANFCSFKGSKYMLKQGVLPSVFPWSTEPVTVTEITTNRKTSTVTKRRISEKKHLPSEEKKSEDKKQLPSEEANKPQEDNNQSAPETEDNTDLPEAESSATETTTKPNKSILKSYIKTLIKSKKEKESPKSNKEITQVVQEIEKPPSPTPTIPFVNFHLDAPLEVLDNNNTWCQAKITELDYQENEILIHFDESPNKCDEWISMKSPRIRAPMVKSELVKPKGGFEVGQRCMAQWSDVGKFPATIVELLDNDLYEVLFDDGFRKAIKSNKITKMVASTTKPPQMSPLFDPIQSSKQERRDKKRILNVAALFQKRPRSSFTGGKNSPISNQETTCSSSGSQDEAAASPKPATSMSLEDWYPTWKGKKPVGVESNLECIEGWRHSTIVPDPRMPPGWSRHLSQRTNGTKAGKWDCIFVAPNGKRFRSKQDIKHYLDLHPGMGATPGMFNFGIFRNRATKKRKRRGAHVAADLDLDEPLDDDFEEKPVKRKRGKPPKPKVAPIEALPPVDLPPVDNNVGEKEDTKEDSMTFKIIFENDTYKCPVEGCGKNYRRENLALMHVKHYHPEYAKYLDSTPKVADLAYARTMADDFDRTPATPRLSSYRTEKATVTPKTSKSTSALLDPANDNRKTPDLTRTNNTEIIKLLTQKPIDIGGTSNPLPPGIKTLLPVRPGALKSEPSDEKVGSKRKRASSDDALKATSLHHDSLNSSLQESQQLNTSTDIATPSIPSAFDLAPPPQGLEGAQAPTVTQFDGVIIEGGKIIKLERMKMEEIINCTCGFIEEDGLMIQCELCLCWQHAYCNSIMKESEVPEKYICYICQNPARERKSMKYMHDQDWLKHGTLPVGSYHSLDEKEFKERCEMFRKCHDVIGGLCELEEHMRSLDVKMKIAKAKDHPKLYLWSKPWDKPKLEKQIKEEPPFQNSITDKHDSLENGLDIGKIDSSHDSMLLMMLKTGKEEMPMLNMHNNVGSMIIPKPQAAIVPVDCKLNLLDHIGHSHNLMSDQLDEFEKELDALEQGLDVERDENYPQTRKSLMLLARDLNTLKQFSELSGS
ncbi:unnamed protein product [Ceutorhynchus assimilis]|uniref:PHD finger protein 20 n=1 Tax=Ceutorhynchus assimilis TaxID=467358 RepID=A0A9P0GQC1_9CUCU|nr:unnamed protein product [Ceutorhynchus assimilis]